jgi:Domain of unknown function (DUF4136)
LFFECFTAVLRRVGRLFLFFALCLILAQSGSAQKVKVDFDQSFDFSKVHRYEWRKHPIFEKHPELADQYSVAIQLVMNSTNQQLRKKGYQSVSGDPDVFLTFFVTARDMTHTYTDMIGPSGAYGWYGWYAPPVWTVTRTEQYVEGTLLMDFVDPKDTRLVWRASATDSIQDFHHRDENVDDAVKKIFKKFPPKQK